MAKKPRSVRRLIKRLAKAHDAEIQATVDRNRRLRPSETSKGYRSIDWATHPKTLIGAREVGSRMVAAELSNPNREKRGPFNGRTGDNQSNPGGFTSDMLKRGVRYDPKPVEPKPIRPTKGPTTVRFGPKQQPEPCKVRVGTTPSHMIPLTDKVTGELIFIRVPAKPKWAHVGEPGVSPKDGGK